MQSDWIFLVVVIIIAIILIAVIWQSEQPRPVRRALSSEQHDHLQELYLEVILQAALMREYAIAINSRTGGASQCAGQVGARVDAMAERLSQTVAYFTVPAAAEEVGAALSSLNKCLESAIVLVKNKQSITEEVAACKEQGHAVVATLGKYVKGIDAEKLKGHLDAYVDATIEEVQDIFSGNCNSSLVGYETKVITASHQFANSLSAALVRALQ